MSLFWRRGLCRFEVWMTRTNQSSLANPIETHESRRCSGAASCVSRVAGIITLEAGVHLR